MGVLDGITVIDLSRYQAGPRCTQILSDLGAEVIRVEDPTRERDDGFSGPTYKGESIYYAVYNRGKKSITLDLRTEEGKRIFRRLLELADVLVENFRPSVMSRLGFSYETVSTINPRIIMTSISGYGQDGPYRDRPAFCTVALALAGYLSLSGDPRSPVHKTGVSIGDRLAALLGTIGTLGALYHRQLTGVGQYIDVSLMDSVFTLVEYPLITYLTTGEEPAPAETRRAGSAPNNSFMAKDGWVEINAGAQQLWMRLATIIGGEELARDPRFDTSSKRRVWDNVKIVEELVGAWTQNRTVAEIVDTLSQAEVPVAPVQTIQQVARDPHVQNHQLVAWVDHPTLGKLPVPGLTIRFSKTPGKIGPPPLKGEHNEEVYCGKLGFTREDLARWREHGVI
jgi:crotonobetainyl-CoA:carnitine CoA-transferase CaiB-like acyl-CoA transferase